MEILPHGKVLANDPFSKLNIFHMDSKTPSTIQGYYDHDSLKTRNKDEFALYLRKEKTKDYHRRNFMHGFLDTLYSSSGRGYVQFLPNPSNRRSIQGVKVTALNMQNLHQAVKQILNAQRRRPDPSKDTRFANVANYSKNWQKFKFPGLTGIKTTTNLTEGELLKKVLQHNKEKVAKLLDQFLTGSKKTEVKIDFRKMEYAMSIFDIRVEGYVPNYLYVKQLRAARKEGKDVSAMETLREKQVREALRQVLEIFYLNHSVNQYSLSQLLYGDEAFFASKEDQTKRIQVVTATGKILLVDEKYGLPPASRIGVLADHVMEVPSDLEFVRNDTIGETFKPTDAEGFMTPEFYAKVAATAGIESQTDIVMKPVYYAIKDGIPVAIKYSVKVLTDALVSKFPHLGALREMMRANKLDQAVFKSAVKVGTPGKLIQTNQYGLVDNDSVVPESIIEIDNRYLRFQLNPAKEVEVTTLNPSQGTSVINTNGKNEAETHDLYELNSLVIEIGLRKLTRQLRLTRKGGLTRRSLAEIRKSLIENAEAIPGNRDLYYLLTHKDTNGKYDVSLSLPLIASKVIANLSSVFSKGTTAFRFKGSKLVLQADFATQDFVNDRGEVMHEPLKFKDAEGYTEVYVPAHYRQFLREGDKFVLGGKDGIVAFRIPSSNYHSLLALKVKGFYPAPQSSDSNIIIAPGPIVYYHGSDNDVDTLFIIRKSAWNKDEDLNGVVNKYLPTPETEALVFSPDKMVGFTDDKPDTIAGQPLHYYLERALIKMAQLSEDIRKRLDQRNLPHEKALSLQGELKLLDKEIALVSDIAMMSAKNAIIHLFSTNLRDPKNRPDLLTPITFNAVSSLKSETGNTEGPDSLMETWAKLEAKRRGEEVSEFPSQEEIDELLYPEGELSDYDVQEQIKSNTDAGGAMVGIAANTLKMTAYSFSSEPISSIRNVKTGEVLGTRMREKEFQTLLEENQVTTVEQLLRVNPDWKVETRSAPYLKAPYQIKYDNKVLDKFRRTAIDFNSTTEDDTLSYGGYPVNIFEVYDTIENLAIDNVKEQKLFILGLTNANANAFLCAIAYGLPLIDVSRIFKTPLLKELSLGRRLEKAQLFVMANDILAKLATRYENGEVEAITKGIEAFTDEHRAQRITNAISHDIRRGTPVAEAIKEVVLSKLYLSSKVLDDIYVGEASEITKEISDALALNFAARLLGVGEQMFKHAQTAGMLKRYPNAKWRMDQVNENIHSLVKFAGEDSMRRQIFNEHRSTVRQYLVDTSPEYKELMVKDPFLAESFISTKLSQLEESPVYSALPDKLAKASFVNRLLRRSVSRDMITTDANVFKSNNLLLLPHLYSAWRGLVQLINLIENVFPMHNPNVKEFAKDILDSTGMYILPYLEKKKLEGVQKEFINFLASNMSIDIGSEEVNLSVPAEETYNSSLGAYSGEEAWCQKFIDKFVKLQETYPDNSLLQSVEVSTDRNSTLKKLVLTSDKVSNEETVERLRQDYRDLLHTPERNVARDLFKYSLLTKGMFFDRTSFSLIFPFEWAAAYAKALDVRLQSVISTDSPARTKLSLIAVRNQFLFQFVRNNSNALSYVQFKPITQKYAKDSKGFDQEIYRGKEILNGAPIYFDLKYEHGSDLALPRFIKRFDDTVYMKIPTGTENATYYRAITRTTRHKFYFLSDPSVGSSFDLDLLSAQQTLLIPLSSLVPNGFKTTDNLEEGEIAYIYDNLSPHPQSLKRIKVERLASSLGGYNTYTYTHIGEITLTDEASITELREQSLSIDSSVDARVVTVSTAREAIENARKQRNRSAVSLVRDDQAGVGDNVYKLDIQTINLDASSQEIADYIERVMKQIRKIPNNVIVYTPANLLDPLMDATPDIAKKFAEAIYDRTGFAFPILSEENLDSRLPEAAQLIIKRREILKAVLNNGVLVQESDNTALAPYRVLISDIATTNSFTKGKIRQGNIISIGQVNGHEVYAFVDYVTDTYLYVTPFSEDVFMLLQEERYSNEDFYKIIDNFNKC